MEQTPLQISKNVAALHGKGVKGYDDGKFLTLVIPVNTIHPDLNTEIKVQRLYWHKDKEFVCRRDDKKRTGTTIGAADAMRRWLTGIKADAALVFEGLVEKTKIEKKDSAPAGADFNDVMGAFEDKPSDTTKSGKVVVPRDF